MNFKPFFMLLILLIFSPAFGQLRVMTTTTNLKAIAEEVGGEKISIKSFCKGAQDPHFLEAKPSYMINTHKADLVIAVGLGLEVGWLPKVLSGGRNPKVMEGAPGYLEVGPMVDVLEIPKGSISRADGDVHPQGNPHVTLDPLRAARIAQVIAEKLSSLDPSSAKFFKKNAQNFEARMLTKTKIWQARINKSEVENVVTHHKTLSYFFSRFGITNVAMLEPLPGVPPTASHVLKVIREASKQGVRKILVENYFSHSVAKKVARQIPGIEMESVPVAVKGSSAIETIEQLFEALIRAVELKNKVE